MSYSSEKILHDCKENKLIIIKIRCLYLLFIWAEIYISGIMRKLTHITAQSRPPDRKEPLNGSSKCTTDLNRF
jgi:hypothetical protein